MGSFGRELDEILSYMWCPTRCFLDNFPLKSHPVFFREGEGLICFFRGVKVDSAHDFSKGMIYRGERRAYWKMVSFRSTPHPVTVTTRIITYLVGNPYKPSFATVTGWGVDPRYLKIHGNGCDRSSLFFFTHGA